MKTLKKITAIIVLALLSASMHAQQDAMFTHYMYNTLAVNPAYAGSRDALTATALHRSQWVDFAGAPVTQTLTLHAPVKSKNIGLGFSLVSDRIGPVKNSSAVADFAYIIKLNEKSKLSFGLKGGLNVMQANLTMLALDQANDAAFQENISSKMLLNFGFGIYYSRERFYFGLSTPKLLENNFKTNTTLGATSLMTDKRHYFLIAGTVIKLSDAVEFKPTTFIKATYAAPIEGDITATFIINKKFLIGGMYRTGDAVGALLGFNITDQFHVGYSFDWSYGIKTFKYNQGSHELMLSYDFVFEKEKVRSPRFF